MDDYVAFKFKDNESRPQCDGFRRDCDNVADVKLVGAFATQYLCRVCHDKYERNAEWKKLDGYEPLEWQGKS